MLCLYDNAGEHFQPGQDTASSPVTRHLARSRAVMFLFDPTQDPRFRSACRGALGGEGSAQHAARLSRQETILNEAAARIRRHAGMPHTGTYERPLVVVLSKLDEWNHLLDTESGGDPWRTQGNVTGVNMDRDRAPLGAPPAHPAALLPRDRRRRRDLRARRHLHRHQLARPEHPARPRHGAPRHPPRRDPADLGHAPPCSIASRRLPPASSPDSSSAPGPADGRNRAARRWRLRPSDPALDQGGIP